jgi:1-acyl-sn-glycerol-3-phosphate acyltransferase
MIVAAPHATFVDVLAIIVSGAIPMAKAEFRAVPVFGKLALFMQIILVQREEETSRKNAVDTMRRHLYNGMKVAKK